MATQGRAAPRTRGADSGDSADVVTLDPGGSAPPDRLGPARGIAIGLGLAVLLWLGGVVAWVIFR